MANFLKKSIARQLTITICGLLGVIFVIGGAIIALFVDKSYKKIAQDYLSTVANEYSESTNKILSLEYSVCSTLQASMELFEDIPAQQRRTYFNEVLKKALKNNENLVDAWCVWEPDALDGLDSRYANTDCHDET